LDFGCGFSEKGGKISAQLQWRRICKFVV